MAVSLTLILTLTVNDSDVRSAAISQAHIDQDWLPADPQINHVHWSNAMGRMRACIYWCMFAVAGYKEYDITVRLKLEENQWWFTRSASKGEGEKNERILDLLNKTAWATQGLECERY